MDSWRGFSLCSQCSKISCCCPRYKFHIRFEFSIFVGALLSSSIYSFYAELLEGNKEKLALPDSFVDFSFWEIPRLKHPLFLIPIVLITSVVIQISTQSAVLSVFSLIIFGTGVYFTIQRFRFNLSPNRKYEMLMQRWDNDPDWIEKWFKRIKTKIDIYGNVAVKDMYEVGLRNNDRDNLEIEFAFGRYFHKYEFEQDLILIRTSQLHYLHPESTSLREDHQWILMRRENLKVRRETNV